MAIPVALSRCAEIQDFAALFSTYSQFDKCSWRLNMRPLYKSQDEKSPEVRLGLRYKQWHEGQEDRTPIRAIRRGPPFREGARAAGGERTGNTQDRQTPERTSFAACECAAV